MADEAKTTRRRRRLGGHELVAQLNAMIAELIKENRRLKRQVEKLTSRGTAAASGTVERSLRTIQRRVQRALTPTKRRRRKGTKTAAGKAGTRKKAARRTKK